MNKMSRWEKVLALLAFLMLVGSILCKYLWGIEEAGNFVILAFVGILSFVIFFTGAFFTADWRMTEKQKAK